MNYKMNTFLQRYVRSEQVALLHITIELIQNTDLSL